MLSPRVAKGPAVARAFSEEKVLYGRQRQRHGRLDAAAAKVLGVENSPSAPA
jgi:hypothetical protein